MEARDAGEPVEPPGYVPHLTHQRLGGQRQHEGEQADHHQRQTTPERDLPDTERHQGSTQHGGGDGGRSQFRRGDGDLGRHVGRDAEGNGLAEGENPGKSPNQVQADSQHGQHQEQGDLSTPKRSKSKVDPEYQPGGQQDRRPGRFRFKHSTLAGAWATAE